MERVDCTPPADLPEQVIIMDKEIAQRHPDKAFYLHLLVGRNVEFVDLEGAVTPLDARRIARDKGYDPQHWMEADKGSLVRFYTK